MPSGSSGTLSNRLACSDASDTEGTLHRKGIGPDAGFDAGPGHGSRDWKPLAHAGRIGSDGGGAAAVSQIIEENPAASVSMRREDIVRRIAFGEELDQPQGIAMRLVMQHRLSKGRHHVDALATGKLRPG